QQSQYGRKTFLLSQPLPNFPTSLLSLSLSLLASSSFARSVAYNNNKGSFNLSPLQVLNLGPIFGFWKLAFQLGRRSCIWGFLSQTPQLSNCLIMGCLSCFNGSYSQLSGNPSLNTGKGKNCDGQVTYGFCLVKGKADHPMEDYHVAKFVDIQEHELGFFAIFDGHLGHGVPSYLQKHLFQNILKEGEFWTDPGRSISKAYEKTDQAILSDTSELARGGSTAVTAILMNGRKLWIGNVGDSRAVLSKRGQAIQMTTDHDPNAERGSIENTGGFVSNMPGDVPRVNGQLAVSRAFGDKNLKTYIRADPDVCDAIVDASTDFLILASDGLWKVMGNQDAVDIARKIRDPQKAAKQLTAEALKKDSKDDISCVVRSPEKEQFVAEAAAAIQTLSPVRGDSASRILIAVTTYEIQAQQTGMQVASLMHFACRYTR
ncbi:hypothetical protein V2J09_013851, partial [Rumex salicifolius]